MSFTDYTVEDAALGWFGALGCAICPGTEMSQGETAARVEDALEI